MRENCQPRQRASTAKESARILPRDVLPVWNGKRPSEITKLDVRALLGGIVKRGAPVVANRTLTAIKILCAWAIEQDLISVSPCAGLKAPAAEVSRDRVSGRS